VLPRDKGLIVRQLKEQGHTVSMAGDGVNGLNVVSWDGTQDKGAKAASGLYIYLVKTKNYGKATGKVYIIW